MKKPFKLLFLALTLAIPSLAAADFLDYDSSNVYVGFSYVQSFGSLSYDKYTDNFLNRAHESDKMKAYPRFDFSAGYRLTRNFRIEGQYLFISNTDIEIDSISKMEYSATAIMVNLFYDLWDLQHNFITPFISAGIGLGDPKVKLKCLHEQAEKNSNDLAWQFQTGINIKLTSTVFINLKYSLLSLPGVEKSLSVNNSGSVEFLNGESNQIIHGAGVGISFFL